MAHAIPSLATAHLEEENSVLQSPGGSSRAACQAIRGHGAFAALKSFVGTGR